MPLTRLCTGRRQQHQYSARQDCCSHWFPLLTSATVEQFLTKHNHAGAGLMSGYGANRCSAGEGLSPAQAA